MMIDLNIDLDLFQDHKLKGNAKWKGKSSSRSSKQVRYTPVKSIRPE